MRITCPYCGARDAQEFAYLGPAAMRDRPKLGFVTSPIGGGRSDAPGEGIDPLRSEAQSPHPTPAASTSPPGEVSSTVAFADWLHLRDNPPGAHRELWYHQAGCGSWLEAERDVTTHAFGAVAFARPGQTG